jgi:hypothetical protein
MNSKTMGLLMGLLLLTVGFGMTVAIISKSSRRFAERRLDEEAVARMDDEGGSNSPAAAVP